jgi:hypothetical protein
MISRVELGVRLLWPSKNPDEKESAKMRPSAVVSYQKTLYELRDGSQHHFGRFGLGVIDTKVVTEEGLIRE